ncbi:MAG TPA: pitrilysin family protein [Terriglobia bacterium]|jgi:zinc protease
MLILLASLIFFLQAAQIVEPYTFREDQGQTTKVILKNGLTVIIREQQALPLTSITTYVKAGYFDEDDRISGISHVIEHMFFKGTSTRPVGAIARETQALGGYLNAHTYYDRTVYETEGPSENLNKALEIQADALWNSTYDAGELKKEIEVVLQENNRKLDNPPAVASEKLYATAFEQHRMRRWRIGTPEGLRALTRDDIVAYVKKYYRPSNIILSIAGQLDIEETINEVVKLYGGIPADDNPVEHDSGPAEPEQTAARYMWQRGPIEQDHVALGFHTPGILSDDARALEVLAAIMGEGRASVLNQFVRDEQGLITSGSADELAFPDLGYFEVDLETSKPLDAQIAVLAEIENIKRNGVTNEQVARAKALIAQNRYHSLETVDGIAFDLAYYEALGDWNKSPRYLPSIQKVSADDVARVAKKYLTNTNLSAFEYLPEMMPRTLGFNVNDYRAAVLDKVAAAVVPRDVQELRVVAGIPSPDNSVVQDMVKPITKRSILRGPDVYVVEDHRLPLVSFGLFYPGGRLYESPRNAGITELMLRSAIRGTKRFNSEDIARRLENAGARIQVVNEPDFFGYIVEGLSGKMDQALDILIQILQQPAFEDDDVQKEKVLQIARIRKLRENNFSYPVSLFFQTLFGSDHAYGRTSIGSEATVTPLTKEDLQAWFKTNERQLVPTIIIDGDTSGTGLVAPLADALTNADLHEREISSLPAPSLKPESKEFVETVPRQQTAMVYGFPGVSRSGKDRYAMVVLENIVSGLGGRFFDVIRDKQGLAYTVRTENAFFTKGGAIYTYVAFSPENEAKVKDALDKEMDRLRKDGVTAEELNKSQAYSIGEFAIGMQTRRGSVLEYARSIYGGEPNPNYAAGIESVTADDVKRAAQMYLDPKLLRIAVVRGKRD